MKRLVVIVGFLFLAPLVVAAPDSSISITGKFEYTNGTLVTGGHNVTYLLYNASSGGTLLHNETDALTITGGVLNAMINGLGSINSDQNWWVGLQVDGGAEMSRFQLTQSLDALNNPWAHNGTYAYPKNESEVFQINGSTICTAANGLCVANGTLDGNNYTSGIDFIGTTTKTLNLARSGAANLTASFSDLTNSTEDMRAAVNNSGQYNITINASNIQNAPWLSSIPSNYVTNNSGSWNVSISTKPANATHADAADTATSATSATSAASATSATTANNSLALAGQVSTYYWNSSIALITVAQALAALGNGSAVNDTLVASYLTAAQSDLRYAGNVSSIALTRTGTMAVTVSGSPITTSGTISLAFQNATTAQDGLLTSTDWNTFNMKGTSNLTVAQVMAALGNASAVNTSANIKDLGFNLTSELSNLYYPLTGNPSGFLSGAIGFTISTGTPTIKGNRSMVISWSSTSINGQDADTNIARSGSGSIIITNSTGGNGSIYAGNFFINNDPVCTAANGLCASAGGISSVASLSTMLLVTNGSLSNFSVNMTVFNQSAAAASAVANGNWSADKSGYATTGNLGSVGNYSAENATVVHNNTGGATGFNVNITGWAANATNLNGYASTYFWNMSGGIPDTNISSAAVWNSKGSSNLTSAQAAAAAATANGNYSAENATILHNNSKGWNVNITGDANTLDGVNADSLWNRSQTLSGTGATTACTAGTHLANFTLFNGSAPTWTCTADTGAGGGNVTGSGGSAGYVATWTNSTNLNAGALWQNSTHVGIRTAVPNYTLDINGDLRVDGMTFYANSTSNNVGIGTTAPNVTLHVAGNEVITGNINVTGNIYRKNVLVPTVQDYFCPFNIASNTYSCYPSYLGGAAGTGGTTGSVAGTKAHPGILDVYCGTANPSGYRYATYNTAFLISGNETFTMAFAVLSLTGLNTTWVEFGYTDGTTVNADPTDGVVFKIVNMTLTGSVVSNNANINTTSNYTLTANAWYVAQLTVNADATTTNFTLYNDTSGAILWTATVTATHPTTAGRETGAGIVAGRIGTGLVSAAAFSVDYMNAGIPTFRTVT